MLNTLDNSATGNRNTKNISDSITFDMTQPMPSASLYQAQSTHFASDGMNARLHA
ncbi:MAG: hypothetical protein IPM82_18625 [Saprospiraceae bacterium]|nr:hypothetical protein [Saprospiraceae bacterium]